LCGRWIATGALRSKVAVLISGVLNLAGAFLSTKVVQTISSGIVDDKLATPAIIFAGPASSSSHRCSAS
jgi:PiT family inorganic phosphate transporter